MTYFWMAYYGSLGVVAAAATVAFIAGVIGLIISRLNE